MNDHSQESTTDAYQEERSAYLHVVQQIERNGRRSGAHYDLTRIVQDAYERDSAGRWTARPGLDTDTLEQIIDGNQLRPPE